ncbi:MAG: restriction endonuclease subunit S [Bacteroidaceae bacterium]|nr:restriction endonuclease subunit S [Bacteroidaceae bacterium]
MVEWKPLYKLVKSISTGLNPRQNFILNEEDASLYYVTVKEITTNKVVFSESTDRITENAKQIINNRSKLSKGDILFSGIGTIGKVAYVDIPTSNWDCSESVFLIKPNELETKGKYLAYILSSDIAKNQYERGAAGAIMKGVRKATLESLLIPIPSLPEQQRIVEQLDTFTNSIENLKEQIAQRRKQYEYYRDQLLDLEGKPGVEMNMLGEVCGIFDGTHQTPNYVESGIKFVSVENIKDIYSSCKYISIEDYQKNYKTKPQKGDVLMTRIGDVGSCALVDGDEPIAYYVSLALLRPSFNIVLSNYVKYILESKTGKIELRKRTLLTAVPLKINLGDIGKIKLPFPDISTQSRIVSILDTFEASIQNLEAQLAQREKQYEYYRNKLLTFE